MKAVILAAGRGSRMRELTKDVAKPMIMVRGKPMIEHIVSGLSNAGIKSICVVTGYKADTIENYLKDGRAWNCTITYVHQEVQDGTAHAVELAKDFVGNEPFLVSYADILVGPEVYTRMLYEFDPLVQDGIIAVTHGEDVSKGSLCFFEKQFYLAQLVEKPDSKMLTKLEAQGLINLSTPLWYDAGVYIFKPDIFEVAHSIQKSSRNEYELNDVVAEMAKTRSRIKGLTIQGTWVDIRDPEVLAVLNRQAI